MPIRQMAPPRSATHGELVAELTAEWSNPDATKTEPVIFEETDNARRLAHVYVIWSKWTSVERVERSEIIMESAERKLSQSDLLNISIAMGSTPDEARRMGMVV